MNLVNKLRKILALKGLSNQKGFTLLELLVVVAILAAIAGTASIALKDTDARASAAAHVAMMDELNKGIGTYRVLQKNQLPNRLDSLMQAGGDTAAAAASAVPLRILAFNAYTSAGSVEATIGKVPATVQTAMAASGISELRYVNTAASAACGDIKTALADRNNNMVPGNVFMSPAANGCGYSVPLNGAQEPQALFWNAGSERLTGQPNPAGAGSAYNDPTNYAYLMTGVGPSSTLFDANTLGGMTTVPVYRHVKKDEYNRFIAVWNVGTYGAAGAITPAASVELVAIVDGALDTKEEELGEWDGTRNTI